MEELNDKEYAQLAYNVIEYRYDALIDRCITICRNTDPGTDSDWGSDDNWLNYCRLVQKGHEIEIESHETELASICIRTVKGLNKLDLQLLWLNCQNPEYAPSSSFPPESQLEEDVITELLYRLRKDADGEYLQNNNLEDRQDKLKLEA